MAKLQVILLVLLTSLEYSGATVSLWPRPRTFELQSKFYVIDPNSFKFVLSGSAKGCKILENAIERYLKLIFLDDCSAWCNSPDSYETKPWRPFVLNPKVASDPNYRGMIYNLTIITSSCEKIPKDGSSEDYTLWIMTNHAPGQVVLYSQFWGALRGLDTFSQLLDKKEDNWIVQVASVVDSPRFEHRGLILETGWHYVPVCTILLILDALAYNKMNVFHWQIANDHSFPYVSLKFPKLSFHGAYSPAHVYTDKDIKQVVNYARSLGIRVIFGFDFIGHFNWLSKGIPGLTAQCYKDSKPVPDSIGPFDPTSNTTFADISEFMAEVFTKFPDELIHLGGNQADYTCWKSNPKIKSLMEKLGFKNDFRKLETYILQKMISFISNKKKQNIVWQEAFEGGIELDPDTIIQVRNFHNYQKAVYEATLKGHKVILTAPWRIEPSLPKSNWTQFYNVDPVDFGGSEQQHVRMKGGEVWISDGHVDSTNIIQSIWPVMAVAAERLWSPQDCNSIESASYRLRNQRCRLLRRGIPVGPSHAAGFCPCDIYV